MSKLRVIPLGGLGEIGMNCMILEYEDEIIVIDCGLLFSDLEHFGVEFVIPDFTYLRDRKEKISAVILTHGHEDHIGALPYLLKAGIDVPVHCSQFTSLLVNSRLKEHGLDSTVQLRPFKMGETLSFKHFKVTTVSVNHSIVDAAALIIDTPAGRAIHTGDFKIDATPFYGQRIDEAAFKRAGDEGVLLLMSDSTNVERHTHTFSESVIYQKFEQLFASAEGLTVVATFASNVARMGQVFKLAHQMGKKVVLAGRTMDNNTRLGQDAGYLSEASGVVIPIDEMGRHKRKDIIILSSGSQAELGSALQRVAYGEHKQIQLQPNDLVIMSSRYIPGNEKAIGRMINELFKQGAEVLYEAVHDIHVSGHATRPELKMMLEWTRPKYFIPIHGEYRHLVHHSKLARETGLSEDQVLTAVNGDVIEVSEESLDLVQHMDEGKILIENRAGAELAKSVIKERRQMAETGVVFALLVRDEENGKLLAGPDIVMRGIVTETMEGFLIEEAQKLVKKTIRDWEALRKTRMPENDLPETIRIDLRRFFNNNVGKKPVVLPIIIDL